MKNYLYRSSWFIIAYGEESLKYLNKILVCVTVIPTSNGILSITFPSHFYIHSQSTYFIRNYLSTWYQSSVDPEGPYWKAQTWHGRGQGFNLEAIPIEWDKDAGPQTFLEGEHWTLNEGDYGQLIQNLGWIFAAPRKGVKLVFTACSSSWQPGRWPLQLSHEDGFSSVLWWGTHCMVGSGCSIFWVSTDNGWVEGDICYVLTRGW